MANSVMFMGIIGTVLALTALVCAGMVFLGIWVYRDAKSRGLSAGMWTAIVLLVPNLIGLILYFLIGRKQRMVICPSCGTNAPYQGRYCPHCGKEIGVAENLPANAKSNKKLLIGLIACFSAFIILIVMVFAMLIVSDAGMGSGASVISSESSFGNQWSVSFYWSTRDYSKSIRIKDGSPSTLAIDYQNESGELTVQIVQGGKTETVPLTGGSGGARVDLSKFEDGKIRVTIKNSNAVNAKVDIRWE